MDETYLLTDDGHIYHRSDYDDDWAYDQEWYKTEKEAIQGKLADCAILPDVMEYPLRLLTVDKLIKLRSEVVKEKEELFKKSLDFKQGTSDKFELTIKILKINALINYIDKRDLTQ